MDGRATMRIGMSGPVRVTRTDGHAVSGSAVDLSSGGLAFLSEDELTPGALIEITFRIPGAERSDPVTCLAEVSACLFYSSARGYRIGARFLNMSDGSRRRIRRLVSARGPREARAAEAF